jgi:prepilin-type N-terminal cleavage/methylation domain-containing protein
MTADCTSVATRLQSGFTLIEVAIVLFVLALLGGAILVPLGAQVEQRAYDETTRTMNDVRDALLGFAVVNRRLPCPDTNSDGIEDPVGGPCPVNVEGKLPWATLGIGKMDAWGQPFTYRVTPAFASSTPFMLTTSPDIIICQVAACTAPVTAVAVIVSGGKNQGNCTGLCPDEAENRNVDVKFVSRIRSQPGTGNEFDDVVVWIPVTTLFSRMIAANLLP